jgi:hypothetical protein
VIVALKDLPKLKRLPEVDHLLELVIAYSV